MIYVKNVKEKEIHPNDHEMMKIRVPMRSVMLCPPQRRFKHSMCPWRRIPKNSGCLDVVVKVEEVEQEVKKEELPPKEKIAAKFVRDSNLPDHENVQRGQVLVKSWIVTNTGSEQWPENTQLVYVSGNSELLYEGQNRFDVSRAVSGQSCEVSAVLSTERLAPGNYRTMFKLAKPDGEQFGDFMWVDIAVTN